MNLGQLFNRLRRHRIELGQCNDLRDPNTLAHRLNERLVPIWYKSASIAQVIQLVIHWIDDLALTKWLRWRFSMNL
jgi:hypothetical protein